MDIATCSRICTGVSLFLALVKLPGEVYMPVKHK